MEEIVASVKKVSELIAEIAAASEEQDAGIRQVNTAVTQMDQVVQQNASLVEEATAATESMKAQAESLLRTMARFRLEAQAGTQPQLPTGQPSPLHGTAPAPIRFLPGAPRDALFAQKPQNLTAPPM
jgi:hypothetical protein